MRNLRYQTAIGLIFISLSHSVYAELIYGFNRVFVNQSLRTTVEFDPDDFKNFPKNAQLKLRVMEGKNIIREDAILNHGNVWSWNKVLPFSENLRFLILKDDQPISIEYLADTKSTLQFSDAAQNLPLIKGIYLLSAPPIVAENEKKRLAIDLPELKNCKDKVLQLVFDKESNALLWQHYGELELSTDEIVFSKAMQPSIAIVTDEGSCGH